MSIERRKSANICEAAGARARGRAHMSFAFFAPVFPRARGRQPPRALSIMLSPQPAAAEDQPGEDDHDHQEGRDTL